MFIDTSAIIAMINNEPGSDEILHRIEDHKGERFISPLVRFEAVASLARIRSGARKPTPEQFDAAETVVNDFVDMLEARDISITPAIGQKALVAARTYGKHVGHEADLNFGDCFSYACAVAYEARLIYKGNDFSKTDLG